MHRLRNALIEHRHFFLVVGLLTLVTTFPTIFYVFKTDVFWLPTGNWDVYIHIWDTWYGKQVLMGQADRLYTNLMFYPEGLSLNSHQFALPNIVAVMFFNLFLPVSNAFSLGWLLIIFSCALSAYVYLLWLFDDKWIALLGAVVFGFSPHVVGEPHHPAITYVAPIPLVLYCFHRGVREQRTILIILAGVLTGLTSIGLMYTYIIVLIMLGLFVCAFALTRWRDRRYWLYLALLIMVVAASSIWGVYQFISDRHVADSLLGWYSGPQLKTDAISFFVNHRHPLLGPSFGAIFHTPAGAKTSQTSYLGYLPLLLICFGLYKNSTRRKMLPWAFLCGVFLILRLGPELNINGVAFPDILLPKYYLDQIPPGIFQAFWVTDQFMAGAVLPLAVLTCFGLFALKRRAPRAAKPAVVLALVAIVMFEYYLPVTEQIIPQEQFDFIDWLKTEEESGEIRLINVPMSRSSSQLYNLYQAFGAYPHAEGAISRTPGSAYDYIRANYLLNAWRNRRPINCEISVRDFYLLALAKLEADGFSHVIYHRDLPKAGRISESFQDAAPSYADEYVSIYQLSDLRDSCPEELSARQRFSSAYADALLKSANLADRHGIAVILAPTIRAADHIMRHVRQFAPAGRAVMAIASDEKANIIIQSSESTDPDKISDLAAQNAVFLVNDQGGFPAEKTEAYQAWFTQRFKFCQRLLEDGHRTIDAYLRVDIPCSALEASSSFGVRYDSGVRLHNVSFELKQDELRFYTAWTNKSLKCSGPEKLDT